MEVIYKKRTGEAIDNRYAVPVSTALKQKIDELKRSKGVDVNEMLRQVLAELVQKYEQGQI